jgi:hypothetical protein
LVDAVLALGSRRVAPQYLDQGRRRATACPFDHLRSDVLVAVGRKFQRPSGERSGAQDVADLGRPGQRMQVGGGRGVTRSASGRAGAGVMWSVCLEDGEGLLCALGGVPSRDA